MSKQSKIAFIGAGNMANALVGGMLARDFKAESLFVTDPYQPGLDAICEQYGINPLADNASAAALADVLVLAVKPQVLRQAMRELRPALEQNKPILVSIAAGITVQSIESWAELSLPVIRCMPNTPALLQLGATGLFANASASADDRALAESILAAVGITAWVEKEELLDAVTAVSGSGPAYFFAVMEAMQASGVKMGLAPDLTQQLVLQTALGAATMASQSDVDVAELRQRVSSKGGTTLAALEQLSDGGLNDLFETALQAAKDRAVEMATEFADG